MSETPTPNQKAGKLTAGQRVKCVDDRQHGLVLNATYTVGWVSGYGCVELEEFPARDFLADRFKPAGRTALETQGEEKKPAGGGNG